MITKDDLSKWHYRKINGIIDSYSYSLNSFWLDDVNMMIFNGNYIEIRFNEFRDKPADYFIVYLNIGNCVKPLKHIKKMKEVRRLFELLTGKEAVEF